MYFSSGYHTPDSIVNIVQRFCNIYRTRSRVRNSFDAVSKNARSSLDAGARIRVKRLFSSSGHTAGGKGWLNRDTLPRRSLLSSCLFPYIFLECFRVSLSMFSPRLNELRERERWTEKNLRGAFACVHSEIRRRNTPTLPVARSRADCETTTARGFHLRPCWTPFTPLAIHVHRQHPH